MERAYKTNVLLTKKQEKSFKDHAVASRVLYNAVLKLRDQRYQWVKCYPQVTKEIKNIFLKKESYSIFVRPWMKDKELSSYTMREAVSDAYEAYDKFFKGLAKFPRLKKLKSILKFRNAQGNKIKLISEYGQFATHIILPSIGKIKLERDNYIPMPSSDPTIIGSKKIRGKSFPIYEFDIIQAAASQKGGKWQISISMHVPSIASNKLKSDIHGADVGSRTIFSVANKDDSYHKEYNLKSETKIKLDKLERTLKVWQRKMSRREVRGATAQSQGWYEAKAKVQNLHIKISNLREDTFHKITKDIVRHKPEQINVEKLSVQNMQQNKKLSPVLQKAGLYKVGNMLRYKSRWIGIKVAEYLPTTYPSTQLCSGCGARKGKNGLKKQGSSKIYHCENCGLRIDRDHNSAIVSAQAPQEVLKYLT